MTRYCGYCGEEGHNKRTCPHRPQEHKDHDKNWHDKSGPSKGTKSKCSFCGVKGHNRRTCWHLSNILDNVLLQAETCVREALSTFVEIKSGVGTMYEVKSGWDENRKSTYVITHAHVRFASGLHGSPHPTFTVSAIGKEMYGNYGWRSHTAANTHVGFDVVNLEMSKTSSELIAFGSNGGDTRILGRTDTPFPEQTVTELVRNAQQQVREYYSKRDVEIERGYGDEYQLEILKTECEENKRRKEK